MADDDREAAAAAAKAAAAAVAADEDDSTFVSADQEEEEQPPSKAPAAAPAAPDGSDAPPTSSSSSSGRLAPSPAPPLASPPSKAGLAAAAAASGLPAALSETAVADLLKHLPEQLRRAAGTTEGAVLLLVSAVVFALASAALLRALLGGGGSGSSSRRRRAAAPRGQGPLVLLAGPSNAGKTAIFLRLAGKGGGAKGGGPLPGTVASMAANTGPAKVSAAPGGRQRTVTLLDVPGHASHRPRLEAALADAAGVVFVVDSADVSPHRTGAADALYDVLSSADFARRRLPLLIACNKSDLELDAHSADFVRKTLERQLDAMRKTRTAGIGRTAAGDGALLGVAADQPFSFAAMAPRHRVSLAEVSARAEGKLAEVEAFAAGV